MSLSVSGISFSVSDFDEGATSPRPQTAVKPTESQQVQQLATAGESSQQIATTLGVPLSQVESALGETTSATPTTNASALVALSARLSVKA